MLTEAQLKNYYEKFQAKKALEKELELLKPQIVKELLTSPSSHYTIEGNFSAQIYGFNKTSLDFLPFLVEHNHLDHINAKPKGDSFKKLDAIYHFSEEERLLYYPLVEIPSLRVKCLS